MKKAILLLVIFLAFNLNANSYYRPYGFCFTPQGELKMLVVFVGFGDNDTLLHLDNWSANQNYPNEIYGDSTFYFDYIIKNNYICILENNIRKIF